MKIDITFEAFKKLVPYLRGALWWAKNDLIKYEQQQFNQNDERIGHPLLSVRKTPAESRFDVVPMLVGTTGAKMNDNQRRKCVLVTGMTKIDPSHKTYFGSIVMPGSYSFEDLLEGATARKHEYSVKVNQRKKGNNDQESAWIVRKKWHECRTMHPNEDKRMVSDSEMVELNRWCNMHHL